MKMKDIAELTRSEGKKKYFRSNMQKLLDLGYVASDQKDVKKLWANSSYFIITTSGLNKVMNYMKYIYGNVFNK